MNNKPGGFEELMFGAVEIVRDISCCSRVCFIAKENGEFIIRAGVPENHHGVGIALDEKCGKEFLSQVMEKKKMVFIGHASNDPRIRYMSGLINAYGVEAVLFAPLYHKDANIGIIVVDAMGWAEKISLDVNLRKVKEFIKFCAQIIGREIEIRQNNAKVLERVKERENFCSLGRHTANISHHFRTSIHIIGGFAQRERDVLGKKISLFESNPELKKLFADVSKKMGIIDREMKRLERYVNDILKFSNVQNCVKLTRENINRILAEETNTIRNRENNVKFFTKLDKRLNEVLVMADAALLSAAFKDIASNAVQAGADTVLIKTELDSVEDICRITIANNGKIIPPEDLNEIFSPFFTTKPDGTGLGLSNTAAIIEAHGGRLEVRSGESDAASKNHNTHFGTRFEISLPLPVNGEAL